MSRGAGAQRQCRADGDDRAQAVRRGERLDADAMVAVSDVELRALLGLVAQLGEGGTSELRERRAVERSPAERRQPEPEREPSVAVAADQLVRLQRDGEPVRSCSGQTRWRRRARSGSSVRRPERSAPRPLCRARRHRLRDCSFHVTRLASQYLGHRRNIGATVAAPRTLSQKVWDRHVVRSEAGEPDLLYIDLHLVHEVTSPQAFDGLRINGRARPPARPHDRHRGPQRAHRSDRPTDHTDPARSSPIR